MGTKRCSKCQVVKSTNAFYAGKHWPDGLHPYCKACFLAHQKERRDRRLALSPGRWRWKRDNVRHDYFAVIDGPIKAYVLGVLAADGSILAKQQRVTLELAAKDAALVQFVRDELVPTGAITARHRRGYEYHILAFVSRKMVADLAALGVSPAKSRTIGWPTMLPSCYAREFVLGYFDGDGHVTYDRHGAIRWPYLGITSGSADLLTAMANVIEQQTGVRPGGPWAKGSGRTYSIRACGQHARIIDRWLHSDNLGLARKRLA